MRGKDASASCAKLKGAVHVKVGEASLARSTTLKIGSNLTMFSKVLEISSSESQLCDRKGSVSSYINTLSENSCFMVPRGDARFALCSCCNAHWRR